MNIAIRHAALPLSLLAAAPALAQDFAPSAGEPSVFDGDYFIVGVGLVALPSYEGSDDTVAVPAAGIAGRVGGIGISPRAAGFSLDLVAEKPGQKLGFAAGPVLRYRMNRTGKIADPVVEKLGKLDGVVEGGFVTGINLKGALNPHDSLSFSVDWRWDLSGKGSGMIASPGLSYITPLSRSKVAGFAASATFVDEGYARYNYGVTPAGAAASGLPAFTAKGGFKDLSLGAFAAQDLNGNLLDGGAAIGLGAMWTRLYGSAADSPITSLRGQRSQWFFGGGLGWVF